MQHEARLFCTQVLQHISSCLMSGDTSHIRGNWSFPERKHKKDNTHQTRKHTLFAFKIEEMRKVKIHIVLNKW